MNRKRIQGYGVLIIFLVVSLGALSCGENGGVTGEEETTQSTAVETSQPSETETSAGGDQTTTQSSPEQTTAPDISTTSTTMTEAGDLSSYRIRTTWRDGGPEGSVESEWYTEFVAEPLAVHHKAEGDPEMEMVFIGQTLWTRFMGLPWREVELPEGEAADWATMLSEEDLPVDVEEQTPLENDIEWLKGQPELKIAEDSLTLAGEETVNGVACKRYTVDSTYTYDVKYQVPLTAEATISEETQGEIWVADQGGWPPFVVRAQLLQTTTTKVSGGGSSVETVYVEQNVTDVNSSDILIEPPQ